MKENVLTKALIPVAWTRYIRVFYLVFPFPFLSRSIRVLEYVFIFSSALAAASRAGSRDVFLFEILHLMIRLYMSSSGPGGYWS